MTAPPNFYHYNDPARPQPGHVWHFVYLHGEAELANEKKAADNGWEWDAPDLFVADQPMPQVEGDYEAVMYGRRVIVFVRDRNKGNGRPPWLAGRAAFPDDPEGLAHARMVEEWR